MKRQKTILFLGICLSAALGFTGCSSDDDEVNEPTVEIKLGNDYRITQYWQKGTFIKPIEFTEAVETPKPEDFALESESNQTKVFHLGWDTTEPGKEANTREAKLTVTNVEAMGYPPNAYALTIAYDVTKFMTATMDKVRIVYKKKSKTPETFDFSCQGYAQKVVQMPMQEFKAGEVPTTAKIELQSFYNQLGISPSEVHGVKGRHCIYASYYGSDVDLNSEFHLSGQEEITFSADYEGMRPVLTIHGLDKSRAEYPYYVRVTLSLGQNQYAAIHIPINVTAYM